MSTQKDYRHCLEQLAAALGAALTSGQSLRDIWEALGTEGLE
jgi:hypothetical protein